MTPAERGPGPSWAARILLAAFFLVGAWTLLLTATGDAHASGGSAPAHASGARPDTPPGLDAGNGATTEDPGTPGKPEPPGDSGGAPAGGDPAGGSGRPAEPGPPSHLPEQAAAPRPPAAGPPADLPSPAAPVPSAPVASAPAPITDAQSAPPTDIAQAEPAVEAPAVEAPAAAGAPAATAAVAAEVPVADVARRARPHVHALDGPSAAAETGPGSAALPASTPDFPPLDPEPVQPHAPVSLPAAPGSPASGGTSAGASCGSGPGDSHSHCDVLPAAVTDSLGTALVRAAAHFSTSAAGASVAGARAPGDRPD